VKKKKLLPVGGMLPNANTPKRDFHWTDGWMFIFVILLIIIS
jgi:hypothetical protein